MKKSIIYITIVGIFIAGGIITGCGSSSTENGTSQSAQQQHSEEDGQHTEGSGDHSSEEGQHSSESGGQHQEEGGGHTGQVHLTEQQRQSLGINVETLNSGSAASTIARPANITYDLDNIAKVGPRLEAKVVKVLKDLGEQVTRGEPIALMSSVELGKTKAEFLRLKARLKSEQARYEREQSLYEQQISSQAELLEAEANYQEARAELNATAEALRLYGLSQTDIQQIEAGSDQPLSRFYISSPIDGVIQERNLSPGQTVSSSETPVHVANLSQMWVMIDAYEQDIRYIEPGQTVNISVRSIPNETFEGTVNWISYALEEDSRTMPIRATLKNTDRQLRAGMFGTARIQTGRQRSIAMIPVDAVQTIEGESRVFVPGGEAGSFRPVSVRLGAENEGLVEVLSGLQPGDQAVTAGAFDLKSALTAQTRSASHGH
ncbi:efflux RND transporter periplasmic adaptor subunit [Fodinibius sediminis]|uniref:Membrane fusion protein, cobalt-zinc-cadmium efflux system n=1 Tax=Fodinibius sediminis TaxID=1214077 RepID=A0A521EGA2_9BACT|nr:efflux RND transporter periplasmic adaptor subunit [Fodinibius sediminis]SMO82501.1 membrane fusion protein, cobalt-zinc-cadmium efflux system [Fodinibius sediminis]